MAEIPPTRPDPKPPAAAPAPALAGAAPALPGPLMAQEIRRSNVRVYVTYGVTLTYCVVVAGLVFWLMKLDKFDLALGVFSGLASVATGVIGFWFGGRRSSTQSGS